MPIADKIRETDIETSESATVVIPFLQPLLDLFSNVPTSNFLGGGSLSAQIGII